MMCLKKKAPGSAASHAVIDAEYSWRDHDELWASGSWRKKPRVRLKRLPRSCSKLPTHPDQHTEASNA